MSIKVENMDKVEAWSGGSILGPGRHPVSIASAEEGTSSGGHDQVELEFDAVDGSGSIRDWLVFTPGTLGKAKMLLDAVGIEPESGEWAFPTAALVDRRLVITVAEEPDYKDPSRTRSRVKAYEAAGTAAPAANGGAPTSDIPADDAGLPF